MNKQFYIYAVFLFALCSQVLTSCTPISAVMTASTSAGIVVAQDKSLGQSIDDTKIKFAVNEKILKIHINMFSHVNLMVDEGRVLMIGYVEHPSYIDRAVEAAWNVKGVQDVINEIEVGKPEGFPQYAQDSMITTKLKTKLTFDKNVHAVNYEVTTLKGVIYIIGIAQNEAEAKHVVNHARNIRHVKKVVSYIRIKDDPDKSQHEL